MRHHAGLSGARPREYQHVGAGRLGNDRLLHRITKVIHDLPKRIEPGGTLVNVAIFTQEAGRKRGLSHFEVRRNQPEVCPKPLDSHPGVFAHHVNLEDFFRIMNHQRGVVSLREATRLLTFSLLQYPHTHCLRDQRFPVLQLDDRVVLEIDQ